MDSEREHTPPLKIEKESRQVVILGDSFMFGWGVESSQTFAAYLEQRLNDLLSQNVIVHSLAIPGTGQVTQLSILERNIRFNPDIVIVGMYITDHVASGNDLIDNLNETYKYNSIDSLDKNSNDIHKIDILRQIRRWLKTHSNLYRFIETRLSAILLAKFSDSINIESDPKVMQQAWAVTDSVLYEMKKVSNSNNAQLIIQYIPNMLDVAQENKKTYNHLQKICNERDIYLAPDPIDILSPKTSQLNDFYYVTDGHWTPEAHKIAAKLTSLYITEIIQY